MQILWRATNARPNLDDVAITHIAVSVLDLTHPYAEWDHTAHFALAVWLLRHPRLLDAVGGIEAVLKRYNTSVGIPDIPSRGYHATITMASMRAAATFLARHEAVTPLSVVLDALMRAEPGDPDWLHAYWRRETIASGDAKAAWHEPDIKALPYPPIQLS